VLVGVQEVAPIELSITDARTENKGVVGRVGRTDLAFVAEVFEDA